MTFRKLCILPVLVALWGNAAAFDSSDRESLVESLSSEAALHGPIQDSNYDECRTLGTDAYAISSAANGICMHAHDCSREFCLPTEFDYDLPSYVVDVRNEDDIIAAINFASDHDLEVSVKTTGHSYQGSSTKRGSFMIWMHNYPKDGTITDNYVDSCGTSHGSVISIGGGETWNDVLEAVKGDYHIVTGGARTVSAAGGWLQGGGLSFSSREYGVGVDQVVAFRVVLANGTAVTANACTNPDLFWALRGGGGGTFGVVTKALYKLHPLTSIVGVDFMFGGIKYAFFVAPAALSSAIDAWLQFWIEKSPYLDTRWSGFFNQFGAHLVFAGSIEDAETTFLNDFNEWYDGLDKTTWVQNVWGAAPPSSNVLDSWYDYKGGPDAAGDTSSTDATGDAYASVTSTAARIMPRSVVIERPQEVKALLLDIELGYVNYFLGGNMNNVPTNETAVHPSLRNSIWSLFTSKAEDSQKVRDFIPNDVTGVCYNHHNVLEPDWRNACWGDNYERLDNLKDVYDPKHMFNCWHCVGYNGVEVDSDRTVSAAPTAGPEPTSAPTDELLEPTSTSPASRFYAAGLVTALLQSIVVMLLVTP